MFLRAEVKALSWVEFYERGVSSKNFSDACGKTYFFDRQPSPCP